MTTSPFDKGPDPRACPVSGGFHECIRTDVHDCVYNREDAAGPCPCACGLQLQVARPLTPSTAPVSGGSRG